MSLTIWHTLSAPSPGDIDGIDRLLQSVADVRGGHGLIIGYKHTHD